PLPSWRHKYDEAAVFAYQKLWRSLLPVFPVYMRASRRAERTADRPLGPRAAHVDSDALTLEIKEFALRAGASAIGIARFDPKYMFDNYGGPNQGDRVITLVVEQDWEGTQSAP